MAWPPTPSEIIEVLRNLYPTLSESELKKFASRGWDPRAAGEFRARQEMIAQGREGADLPSMTRRAQRRSKRRVAARPRVRRSAAASQRAMQAMSERMGHKWSDQVMNRWDQAALDKMVGIDRHEGMTLTDRRPFSQSGMSSAPRQIGPATAPGMEPLANPYRAMNYGQWDLEGKWAPKPPHGSGMSYDQPSPRLQTQRKLARSLGQEVPPWEPPPLTHAQQRLTSRVGPGGVDPRPTHPLAGEFGYGTTVDPNAVDPPATKRQQRRWINDPARGSKGYGPTGSPTTAARKTMGRIQGPENIIHQVKDVPRYAGAKEMGRPSPEIVKMMAQWENMVKGPKKQLAQQLTKFAAKWGLAGIKFMAKLPK